MSDAKVIPWAKILDALIRVEEVSSDEVGLLHFGDDPRSGGIFVEGGRVCWAAARGMQQRLRELLGDGHDLAAMNESELAAALRRHSAESLVELCRDDAQPIWMSRGGRGFGARFTFRPVDVFLEVVALYAPEAAANAARELAPLISEERHAAAFRFGHDAAIPLAAYGDFSLSEARALGRWANALPAATRELGATPAFTFAATAAGDTLGVWWSDDVLYAVACSDRRSSAALATYLTSKLPR